MRHLGSLCGEVWLHGEGAPELDYPMSDFVIDGAHRGRLDLTEIQFAACARTATSFVRRA